MSEQRDAELFQSFAHLVETLPDKNIPDWEREKSRLVDDIENFYQQKCLNVNNELPETVPAQLEEYRALVKKSFEDFLSTICTTYRQDFKDIHHAASRLAKQVQAKLRLKDENLEIAKLELRILHDNHAQSSNGPGAAGNREGMTRTNASSPLSDGSPFEGALERSMQRRKEENRVKPPRTPSTNWNPQNPARSESPTPGASMTNTRPLRSNGSSSRFQESPNSRSIPNSPSLVSSWFSAKSSQQKNMSPAASRQVSAGRGDTSDRHLLNQEDVPKNKQFEDIHPMMKDLFQHGSILNLEYEEGLTTIDPEEPGWASEDEDREGEEKEEEWGEDQLPQQVEYFRSKLKLKTDSLKKAKSEMAKIRIEKDQTDAACRFLLQEKEALIKANETVGGAAPFAVDVTNTSFSPATQSGNKSGTSEPDSTVALPSMGDGFAKLLGSHRQRLETAIARCDDERIDCETKMTKAQGKLDPWLLETLDHWVNNVMAHRNDFALTVGFFDGAMKDVRANPGSLNLADEIGDTPLSMSIPSTSSRIPNSGIFNRKAQPTRPGRMRSKSEVLVPSLLSRAETFGSRLKSIGSSIAEDLEPSSASNSKDVIPESQDTSKPAVIQSGGSKSAASSEARDSLVEAVKSRDSPKKPDDTEEAGSPKKDSPKKSGSQRDGGIPQGKSVPNAGGLPKQPDSHEEEDSPRNVSPEKSTSPKKDSPTNETSKNEGSPKKSDSLKKEDSSKEGDSQGEKSSSENSDIPEKDESPETDDAPNSKTSRIDNLSTPARGKGDDDPSYPENDLTPRTDQLINLIQWLCGRLFILLVHILVYVASHFRAWVRFFKFVYQMAAYPFRRANGVTTTFDLPQVEDIWLIANHVLFAMNLHVYLEVQRERNQWYDANGLTRNIMLARIANPPSWFSFLGGDRVLSLGGYFIYALWHLFSGFVVWFLSIPLFLWNIVDFMLHLFGVYELYDYIVNVLWLLYEVKDFSYCCYLGIKGYDGAEYCFSSLQSPGFKAILEEYHIFRKFF
ncbi:hypothetical protein ACHAP5_000901 [Fusarium lateritium]